MVNVANIITVFFYTLYCYLEALVKLFLPAKLKSLEGEIVLVTGSGSGIGRAICLELAKHKVGAIVCWDYVKEGNDKLVKELKAKGIKAFSVIVDVSEESQVKAAAEKTRKEVGDVSIVINNAGVGYAGELIHSEMSKLEKVMKINIFAHFYILKEFLPKMIEKKKGHIAATSSLSAYEPFPYGSPYVASKFAVNGFMETMRKEMLLHPNKPDIKFTTVFPFFVNTVMVSDRTDTTKIPGIVQPDYVAQLYVEAIRKNQKKLFTPPSCIYFVWLVNNLLPQKVRDLSLKYFHGMLKPKKSDSRIDH